MKKDIYKELGIKGGFTMSAKQIKNHTATYCICNIFPYEKEIARAKGMDETVQGYEGWSDAEKANSHKSYLEFIAMCEEKLAKYGTREREAREVAEQITNSMAFEKFQNEIGKVDWHIEQMDICYYIRFNY